METEIYYYISLTMYTIPSTIDDITYKFYELTGKEDSASIKQYVDLLFELYNSKIRKFMQTISNSEMKLIELPVVKLAAGRISKSLYEAIYEKFNSYAKDKLVLASTFTGENTMRILHGLHVTNTSNHFDLSIGHTYIEKGD